MPWRTTSATDLDQLLAQAGQRPRLRGLGHCKPAQKGAKVVSHGRYVTFQMTEVAVPRQMFADILSLVARLRALPAPA
jgi:hypothetical protein